MPTINKGKKNTKPITEDTARKNRMKVYNKSLWRNLTDLKRRENPLCEVCLMQGKITPAEHTHHIITFTNAKSEAERDKLAFDYNNLISICSECHNRLHHSDLRGCTTIEGIKNKLADLEKTKD